MHKIKKHLEKEVGISDIQLLTLLNKPTQRDLAYDLYAKFCGFDIPDMNVVGYGLNSHEKLSSIPHIFALNSLGKKEFPTIISLKSKNTNLK